MTVKEYALHLIDYSERILREFIGKLKKGTYTFFDFLDDDGYLSEKIKIEVKIVIDGDKVIIDFSNSDPQVQGNVNAVYAITLSAVLYVFRSLVNIDIPTNTGCFKPLVVITKKGTLLDATFPAAVAAGNVETSQRIVDVVLGALGKALPNEVPAASQGTMNNITIGGVDNRYNIPFTYYETIGGGMGAAEGYNGASAVQTHMTNTLNTPVEALEFAYPLEVVEYAIRKDSGGKGKYRGGDGIVRDIKLLTNAEVTVLSERRKLSPYGLFGGENGMAGENIVIENNINKVMPSKFSIKLKKDDRIIIKTPGGGGFKNE